MLGIPVMMQPVGYMSNFSSALQNMQTQGQLGVIQQQLAQLAQNQTMMEGGIQQLLARDQYGQMSFPQMGQFTPMGGMVPMGGISPLSQMAGVAPPNEIMQTGGLTQGLKDVGGTGSPPFPKGSQETAGGYIITPTNDSGRGFVVYKPGAKGADKDDTAFISNGDPHVYDKSGKELFSYTKNSDFQLPDGTTLTADTTSQTGRSYISKLGIINGNSHVDITWGPIVGSLQGGNAISVTPDQNDGIQALANRYQSTNWSQDTFKLALDGAGNPSFYDFVRGQDEGKVIGDTRDSKGTYLPTVDHNQVNYAVAPQYQPAIGTPAYGNQLFGNSLQQVLDDPKYQNSLPPGEIAQITANWYNYTAQTQNMTAGQSMPLPGYSGSPWGGGVGPGQMGYLQSMYSTLPNYAPIQLGGMIR